MVGGKRKEEWREKRKGKGEKMVKREGEAQKER